MRAACSINPRHTLQHSQGCSAHRARRRETGCKHTVHCNPVEAPFAAPAEDAPAEEDIKTTSLAAEPVSVSITVLSGTALSNSDVPSQQPAYESSSRGLWADVGPLLKFAIPTLCIAVTSPLMSLADTSVVGLYSEAQLAAMSPATTVCDGIYYMMTFIPMAVTNLVSLQMAKKNHSTAGVVVSQALAFSTCLCVIISASLLLYAPSLFAAMGSMPGDMINTASGYVRACAPGLPFAVCNAIMSAFFLACRAPRIPMTATAAAGLVNLFGDLLLCRVFSFGAVGAAIATSTANIIVFFYMLHKVRQRLPENSPYAGVRVPIKPAVPHAATVRTLVMIAGPILGVLALKVLLFSTISIRAVGEGLAVSAGHRIIFGHAMLMGIFGETICNAAQAFLPPRIGTPEATWSLMRALTTCAIVIGLFNATVAVGVAYATLPLFTNSPQVIAVATSALPILSLQGLMHAVSMGTEGVLLAARDGWFLLATYGLAFVVLNVLLDITLGWGWGIRGLWTGSVVFMSLRLAMNSWRLLRPNTVLSSLTPLSENTAVLQKQSQLLAKSATPNISESLQGSSDTSETDRNIDQNGLAVAGGAAA